MKKLIDYDTLTKDFPDGVTIVLCGEIAFEYLMGETNNVIFYENDEMEQDVEIDKIINKPAEDHIVDNGIIVMYCEYLENNQFYPNEPLRGSYPIAINTTTSQIKDYLK